MFESEAAYLDRYGLFLPGERQRLTAADFEPVSLFDVIDIGRGDPTSLTKRLGFAD